MRGLILLLALGGMTACRNEADELEMIRAKALIAANCAACHRLYDDGGNVGRTYGAIGLPVHIFINRHGIVTTYRQGEMDPGQIEAAIKDALK